MVNLINSINETPYNGLSVLKLIEGRAFEGRLICLEKGTELPPHISKKDAFLILLEGQIDFHIDSNTFKLKPFQLLTFQKDVSHRVHAKINSKFLLLR